MARICAGSLIQQVAVSVRSSNTSSPSKVVSVPGLPGMLVCLDRSFGIVTDGCSETWIPYTVQRVPFHSNQSFKKVTPFPEIVHTRFIKARYNKTIEGLHSFIYITFPAS